MIFVTAAAVAPQAGMTTTAVVTTLVVAFVGSSALTAGIVGFLNRRKISSEAENIQAQTSDLVWKRVKAELETMQVVIDHLRESDLKLRQRLDVVEPLLRDTTRTLHLAVAHIERLYDAWPRDSRPAPPIPHDLVAHLPRTIVEDPTIPPAPPRDPDDEVEQP